MSPRTTLASCGSSSACVVRSSRPSRDDLPGGHYPGRFRVARGPERAQLGDRREPARGRRPGPAGTAAAAAGRATPRAPAPASAARSPGAARIRRTRSSAARGGAAAGGRPGQAGAERTECPRSRPGRPLGTARPSSGSRGSTLTRTPRSRQARSAAASSPRSAGAHTSTCAIRTGQPRHVSTGRTGSPHGMPCRRRGRRRLGLAADLAQHPRSDCRLAPPLGSASARAAVPPGRSPTRSRLARSSAPHRRRPSSGCSPQQPVHLARRLARADDQGLLQVSRPRRRADRCSAAAASAHRDQRARSLCRRR